jgi:hypothetical protein
MRQAREADRAGDQSACERGLAEVQRVLFQSLQRAKWQRPSETLPAVKRYARTSRACCGFSAAECRRRNRETKRSNDRVGIPLCYWLSHCDSVGCRESIFQSRLKSRLEALPFSVLLFLVWLKASSLGSERHSFSPVADALLPESSPRSTVDIHTLEAERIACTQCYVCKSL